MAHVYHVVDAVSGRELALKQLLPGSDAKRHATVSLFEAEFNALAQLAHPRVIEVYDYGLDEGGPFYTMELLDGGDLAVRSPMPWREACALIYDVCSSLALLHSRRFLHRDISPRNVRCTHDGRAKLIDFGAMAPMGVSSVVAGTPAFVAPEVVHRSALDGRTDLFSLGATLFYALTKRPPFAARSFHELVTAWNRKPMPPSSFDSQIPPALDALVLSLLSLDPARRPRTAFEVMQRLSAIAGLDRDESQVSQAYLWTPMLVARERVLAALAERVEDARAARGSACLLRTQSGAGRSRVLDACVLEAKAKGAIVLRASATGASVEDFAVAQVLADQLLDALGTRAIESARHTTAFELLFEGATDHAAQGSAPAFPPPARLQRFSKAAAGRNEVADALEAWLRQVSRRHLLLVAVDDMQRCDAPSVSLLAALAAQLGHQRLLLVLTIDSDAPERAPDALQVLAKHCRELELEALTRDQTEELLSSIFGAAPNLGVLTEAIHEIARGNPRKCLDVAQHLVDRGALRYADGSWTLPGKIAPALLPRSAEDAMRERLAGLPPLARFLAEAHALSSFDSCSRDDYLALQPDASHQSVDRALLELLSHQVLTSEGSNYALARHAWAGLLDEGLDEAQRRARHRALAQLYEHRSALAAIRHLLAAGEPELGLARLMALFEAEALDATTLWQRSGGMRMTDLLATFEHAHRAAHELGRPARERMVIQGWLVGLSVIWDDSYYFRFVAGWRAQLEHDSGYTIYCQLEDISDAGARLTRALTLLSERYAATPEVERVYAPEEAIRLLVLYVGVTIAIGSRTYDWALLEPLPRLLEPFAPLSRVIDAVRLNAMATCDIAGVGRLEQGRAGWIDVYDRLMQVTVAELSAIAVFRNAVAYAIGLTGARIGLDSAKEWVERIEGDPAQRVSALYLRKVMCLHRGDFEGAERWRRQAELVELQSPIRQMFTNVLIAELWAHAAAGDLVGVKQVLERIVPLSERYPGWIALRALAEAQFQSARGDLEAACVAFERCLELCKPDPREPLRTMVAWPSCVGSYVDTLLRLGRCEAARAVARAALELCRELDLGTASHEIARGLALADARLGDHAGAWTRLEQLIEAQTELGISGLPLGASYEACARVAICTRDEARLQRYARLTATEYRYGHGSALGARYERLMEEARQADVGALPELSDFVSSTIAITHQRPDPVGSSVFETMTGATDRRERAQRALRVLCEPRGAHVGHLYMLAPRGIALAASQGATQPPDGLRDFLERYLLVEQQQCEGATAVVSEGQADSFMESCWSDPLGQVHQPVVLTGTLAGTVKPIGIVSFVIDGNQARPANEAELCSAVAAYLIGAGDVQDLQEPG